MDKVDKIGFLETNNSEIEALILEANLIKKYQPKYNVVWKDGKNYFYVAIAQTNQKIPYIYITHQPQTDRLPMSIQFIGPFVEGTALKKTLRFLRKVFPYYTSVKHSKNKCTYCHLDLCPGPNPDLINYKKNIKKLILILQGKRNAVLDSLKKEMKTASKENKFEEAGKIRDKIYALQQVMSHTHVIENSKFEIRNSKLTGKIECYDVSNIQGKQATGSMVVFKNGKPNKNEYRKFKIKLSNTPNDTAMLKEVLQRRFTHPEWPMPDVILIDGGKAQLNVAIKIKNNLDTLNSRSYSQSIRVMAIAKGKQELFIEGMIKPIPLKQLPQEVYNLIKQLDDEAHRFAIAYHKTLRKKNLFQ
jgi:excinuclease ABC subunit C